MQESLDPESSEVELSLDPKERGIARIVGGEADFADWSEFESIATREPRAWEELARTFHAVCSLQRDVTAALAGVETTPLPDSDITHRAARRRRPAVLAWAALVLVAFSWGIREIKSGLESSSSDKDARSGLAAEPSSRQLYDRYVQARIDEGGLLRELPRQVVRVSRAQDGGGVEVVYVRRLLEREEVKQFYALGASEQGTPAPFAVDAPVLADLRSF